MDQHRCSEGVFGVENVPRHLPVGDVAYRYTWVDQVEADGWKADSIMENITTDAVSFTIAE